MGEAQRMAPDLSSNQVGLLVFSAEKPIKEKPSMAIIKMYTTSWCGDCRMTKMFLAEKNISYEEIDIEETPGAAEIVMKANDGKRKVPTLDIDGRFLALSPFNRRQLEEALGLA
jgi:mycoredoxin